MKNIKKFLCLVLALTMCLSLVNLSALADETTYHCNGCGKDYTIGELVVIRDIPAEDCKDKDGQELGCPECGYTLTNTNDGNRGPHSYEKEVTTPATCKDDGVMTYTCSVCGDSYTESIPKTEQHTPGDKELINSPSCTEKGNWTVKCLVCGCELDHPSEDLWKADYAGQKWKPAGNGQHKMVCRLCNGGNPDHVQYSVCEDKDNDGWCDECGGDVAQVETPCEHNMVWEITDNPTCTKKGNRNYHCTKCDYVEKNESIDPLGHEWGPWTDEGESLKHFRYCKRDNCDCEYNVYSVTGVHNNWEYFTKEPTCTENGYTEKKCPDCGYTETTVISATDHDWDYEHGEVIVKPTVNKDGTIRYTCNNDPSHTKDAALKFSACDQVDENGKHKAEYLVTKDPTCTEKGAAQWWCPSCETVFENVEISAKGHQTKIVVDNEPTCIEKGNEHEVCTVCGVTVENKENSALGHKWSGWQPDGAKGHYQVCDRCESHNDTVDHRFGDWETVKEATTTEEGLEKHTCADCGYEETRTTSKTEVDNPGNQGGNNNTTRYTLTINYQYADGTKAAEQYSRTFVSGASYNVPSPAINGYSPDYAQVMGNLRENLTVTVTYTLIEDIGDQDPPLADAPEDKDPIGSNPPETDVPDEQPPLTDISDEEPPLVDSPDQQPPMTDLPAEWPPLAEVADPSATDLVETDISDEDVPLASVPQTGDISLVWYVAVAMSAMGLVALTLKKREDEED